MALGFSLERVASHVAVDGWRATGFRSGVLVIDPPGSAVEQTVRLPSDGVVLPLAQAAASCPQLCELILRHRLKTDLFVAVPSVHLPLRAEARWLVELTIAARAGDLAKEATLLSGEVARAQAACPMDCELATRVPADGKPSLVALTDQALITVLEDRFPRLAGTRFIAVPNQLFDGPRLARRRLASIREAVPQMAAALALSTIAQLLP